MNNSFFTNENQLSEWIEASEGIKDSFGINKALGYLIGEKFYTIIHLIYSSRKVLKTIEEQRKKPDYNPIDEYEVEGVKLVSNEGIFTIKIKILSRRNTIFTASFLIQQELPLSYFPFCLSI